MRYPTIMRDWAARVWELHGEVRRMRQLLRRELARPLEGQWPSVVEVGCGFGTNAPLCGGAYLGLERDPSMVRRARRAHGSERVRFECVDAGSFRGEAFDIGLVSMALHEADDRPAVLGSLAALARRRIVICDYNPRLRGLTRMHVAWTEEGEMDSYWGFDAGQLLTPLGFELDHHEPISSRLHFWRYLRAE